MRYRLRTLLIVLALLPPILAVMAPPVVEWLTKEQLPPSAKVVKPVTKPAPYFAAYTLKGAVTPADAYVVMSTILACSKSARMQVDIQTGTVSLFATPVDHAAVQAKIDALHQVPPPTTRGIRKPPGNLDYQFPPQPRKQISDEGRNPNMP